MATYNTLRASSTYIDDGYLTSPSGTPLAVTSDSLDTTYTYKPNNSNPYFLTFYVTNPSGTLPASGDFIVGQRTRCRMSQPSGGNLTATTSTTYQGTQYIQSTTKTGAVTLPSTAAVITSASRASTGVVTITTASNSFAVNDLITVQSSTTGTPANFMNATYRVLTTGATFTAQDIRVPHSVASLTASSVNATNGNISLASNFDADWLYAEGVSPTGSTALGLINNVKMGVFDAAVGSQRSSITDIYLEVWTSPIPTVSSMIIDGDAVAPYVVTTTTRPDISWTYGQADGLAQTKYQVKIFNYAPADPETAIALYDSGVVTSSQTTASTTYDLTNATTYYVYIKVGTSGIQTDTSSTYDSGVAWSLWTSNTFTTSFTPPTTPVFFSIAGGLYWTGFQVTGAAVTSPILSQTYQVQRSINGLTWYDVRGASALVPGAGYTSYATDYDQQYSTNYYRARAVGVTATGTIASPWATTQVTAYDTQTRWVIRSLDTTSRVAEVSSVRVLADIEMTQEETLGIFRPQGRSTPIVVHGDIQGRDGEYEIICIGDQELADLLYVINSQLTIWVMDAFNEQKYIRVTGRSWTKMGTKGSPRYMVKVSYVAVGSGLTAG